MCAFERFRALVKYNKEMYKDLSDVDIEAEIARYTEIREKIRPCVRDATFFMYNVLKTPNKYVIIEGANATMLDIDFGKCRRRFIRLLLVDKSIYYTYA